MGQTLDPANERVSVGRCDELEERATPPNAVEAQGDRRTSACARARPRLRVTSLAGGSRAPQAGCACARVRAGVDSPQALALGLELPANSVRDSHVPRVARGCRGRLGAHTARGTDRLGGPQPRSPSPQIVPVSEPCRHAVDSISRNTLICRDFLSRDKWPSYQGALLLAGKAARGPRGSTLTGGAPPAIDRGHSQIGKYKALPAPTAITTAVTLTAT